MNRRFSVRFTVVGALAMALLVSGCGRKGPLDPPPGAWVTPPGTKPIAPGQEAQPRPDARPDGAPIAPDGPKRRLPGDWLLE